MLNRILFFDIETKPNKELIAACPPTFRAPAALTDSVEVMRWIAEKELRFPKSGAALDLDYAKITAIGLALGEEDPQAVLAGVDQTEKDTLKWFWSQVARAKQLCGYNIVGFDLPIIQRRSFVLGVTPTRRLFDLKPWDAFTLDLMRAFYHNGYGPGVKYRGLKQVCKLFGIDNPLPELDGSQAAGMDPDTLRRYVVNDVEMTRELWRRGLGHYW